VTIGGHTQPSSRADKDGFILVAARGPQLCIVEWGPLSQTRGPSADSPTDFPFRLEVFLNISDDDVERAAHQRLNNLGYHVEPPAANVATFQRDYSKHFTLEVTGKLDPNTINAIRSVHDMCLDDLNTAITTT
jgi:hypothetical protein